MFKSVGLYLALFAVLSLAAYVGLGLYGALANVQEDDASFNCHVMGDMDCKQEG
jgi:hypothetical protein